MSEQVKKINISEKLTLFSDLWSPKIIGEINDSYIKLAKFKGEFTWHSHEHEDEMFFIIKGTLTIQLRNKNITLTEGECCIIPKGIEHCPVTTEEVHVMLLEPKNTINTGNQITEQTVSQLEWI